MECVQSCWAQEYMQRPTAERIEESFKASNLMTLNNSYEIESTTVCAALVTKTETEQEIIWIVSASDGINNLVSYTFSPLRHVVITMPSPNKYVRHKLRKMVSNCIM